MNRKSRKSKLAARKRCVMALFRAAMPIVCRKLHFFSIAYQMTFEEKTKSLKCGNVCVFSAAVALWVE